MILKMRYVAWTSLYEFQGSRRCFIPWYDYDTILMRSFCWNVFDILFMYSHYCLVPNEMLYLDRSHSHHADNVLQFLYVNTCVELCDSMLNCPHQFSFTSIYIYICFLRSRISPASSSLNQRSIHHLCLLSRKPVVLPACHPRLLRSTAVIPWKTRCTSQDMESKNMSPMQRKLESTKICHFGVLFGQITLGLVHLATRVKRG